MDIKIAPSLLDADLTRLAEAVAELEEAGADVFHVDVMDGHFVPCIKAGPRIVEVLKQCATIPIDVHLMICDPLRYAPVFVEAGADVVLFHVEAVDDPAPVVETIKEAGAQCGIALKPHTPAQSIAPVAGDLDCLMAMTVEPGFSGQAFMEVGCQKIPELRRICGPDVDVYVDGGIGLETVPIAVGYGANVIAAASSIFKSDLPPGQALVRLRKTAEASSKSQAAQR